MFARVAALLGLAAIAPSPAAAGPIIASYTGSFAHDEIGRAHV